jgi:cation transport regulator ChaB
MATKTKSDHEKALDKAHDQTKDAIKRKDMVAVREGAHVGVAQSAGVIDNMTRADDDDVIQGQFCKIDLNHDGVSDELRESHRDYGVYEGPGSIDPDNGRPILARVQLRDDSHEKVVVPYESLRPSRAGGR